MHICKNCCIFAHFFVCDIKMQGKMSNVMERESNAELLRILCIIAILLHHFCIHALYPEIVPLDMINKGWDSHLLLSSYAFIYLGVNCFILISGWFGIKTRLRGFLNLYLIYAFYTLIASYDHIWSWDTLRHVLLPFSQGDLWFMNCYLGLFLLAPILNAASEHMNIRQHAYSLILLSIASVYFGGFWQMGAFDTNGYTIAHFVYLYWIGSFLRRIATDEKRRAHRWCYFGVYVGSAILWGTCAMSIAYGFSIEHWNVWGYNNPLLLITSIAFFLFVMSWHFKSKIVNWLAMSSLSVYILNDMVFQYDFIRPYAHAFAPWQQLGLLIGVALCFYLLAVGIDQIRILITQPILNKLR